MAMVVETVMIEPRIIGTITRTKSWRSLAPSSRAASRTSPDTPLIDAEKTTMAKPVWSQTRITISQKMLSGLLVSHGIGSPPRPTTIAFNSPICVWPSGCQA